MPNFKTRPRTDHIVVHTAATRPSMDIGAAEIRRWHLQRGWLDIGYHYVIRRDGTVEEGRPRDAIGAHVSGHNTDSIGICLVGGVSEKDVKVPENNYTKAQMEALHGLLETLKTVFPKADIRGHRDFPGVAKACPCFDVRAWLQDNPLFEGPETEDSEPDTAPIVVVAEPKGDAAVDDTACFGNRIVQELRGINKSLTVLSDDIGTLTETLSPMTQEAMAAAAFPATLVSPLD